MDLDDFPPRQHISRDLQISYRFPDEERMRLHIPAASHTSAGRRIAWATAEFARVPRADRNVDLDFERPDTSAVHSLALEDSGLTRPYPESVGMQVLDAEKGVIELAFVPYIRNSAGILHGGVMGTLAVEAAEVAARAEHPTARASGADIQFLSPGRVGPFRTSTESMSVRPIDHVWRVETRDLGDAERAMTRALVTTTSA
jgi:acyl-coenzyme A thioesterase PaaI-like protein